jgi:hypothetical protein
VTTHFVCGERRHAPELYLGEGSELGHQPLASGVFVSCVHCGGMGPRYMAAPTPTLEVVEKVEHSASCSIPFELEVMRAVADDEAA